jgi:small subunit ribosomal protein S21
VNRFNHTQRPFGLSQPYHVNVATIQGSPVEYDWNGGVPLAEVQVHEGESLESALKRFKRKVLQEDIIKEIKRHAFYLKPGQKKRVKEALARKRNRKKRNRDVEPDQAR